MLLLPHLFESIGFVDNFGAAGSKVLVTELREDSGPRLDVDSEALHARGVTPQLRPVIKYDDYVPISQKFLKNMFSKTQVFFCLQ